MYTVGSTGRVKRRKDGHEGAMGMDRDARREAIERAAYAVLAEKGYRRTSMLAVAKAAHASNQTLYQWYGTKQGLFRALIERNADEAIAALTNCESADPDVRMAAFGRALLRVLTGEKAIALNRAAAADADETGELGRTLAASGRERVLPVLIDVLRQVRSGRNYGAQSPSSPIDRDSTCDLSQLAELYIALLVGDLQIRRATGALAPLDEPTIDRRVQRAWAFVSADLTPS